MFREEFPVPDEWANRAWADDAKYQEMYQRSIDDPEGFWGDEGKRLDWIKPYTQIRDVSWDTSDVHVRWYYDGVLNASANCLDRHLATRGDQTAIIWEGDDPKDDAKITYNDLYARVCKFSNGLKSLGVKKATASLFTCR
jgi:acetyl-CoA synthetase